LETTPDNNNDRNEYINFRGVLITDKQLNSIIQALQNRRDIRVKFRMVEQRRRLLHKSIISAYFGKNSLKKVVECLLDEEVRRAELPFKPPPEIYEHKSSGSVSEPEEGANEHYD
jgi:hypothetical protein